MRESLFSHWISFFFICFWFLGIGSSSRKARLMLWSWIFFFFIIDWWQWQRIFHDREWEKIYFVEKEYLLDVKILVCKKNDFFNVHLICYLNIFTESVKMCKIKNKKKFIRYCKLFFVEKKKWRRWELIRFTGYGNICPKTKWGKVVTIVYAIIGLPLFLLYLSNIGDILAKSFKWTYARCCLCK